VGRPSIPIGVNFRGLRGTLYAFPRPERLSAGGVLMENADIEQRFHLMQKEIEATVSLMTENKLDLMAAIDSLRIELEVLKTYMERFHPGFAESYPQFREEAIQAIDPEWMASASTKRVGAGGAGDVAKR
jgi:hypothetical protein